MKHKKESKTKLITVRIMYIGGLKPFPQSNTKCVQKNARVGITLFKYFHIRTIYNVRKDIYLYLNCSTLLQLIYY